MVEAFIVAPLNFRYETKDGSETIHAGFYGGKADDSIEDRHVSRALWVRKQGFSRVSAGGAARGVRQRMPPDGICFL
jgi:hypothetical protein